MYLQLIEIRSILDSNQTVHGLNGCEIKFTAVNSVNSFILKLVQYRKQKTHLKAVNEGFRFVIAVVINDMYGNRNFHTWWKHSAI